MTKKIGDLRKFIEGLKGNTELSIATVSKDGTSAEFVNITGFALCCGGGTLYLLTEEKLTIQD